MKKIYTGIFIIILLLMLMPLDSYADFKNSFTYYFNKETNNAHPGKADGQTIWCRHRNGKLTKYDGGLKYNALTSKDQKMDETLAGWLYEVEHSSDIKNKNGRSGAIQTILWEQNGKSNNDYNFSKQKISLGGILRGPNKLEIAALNKAKKNIKDNKVKKSKETQGAKDFKIKNYDSKDTIKDISTDKASESSMNLLDGATSNTDIGHEEKIVSYKSGSVVDGSTYVKEGDETTNIYADYYIMENVPFEWDYGNEHITDIQLIDMHNPDTVNLKCAWKEADYIHVKSAEGIQWDLSMGEGNKITDKYGEINSNEGFKIYIPKKNLSENETYKIRIMTDRGKDHAGEYAKIVIPFKINSNETFKSPYENYWILDNVNLDWEYKKIVDKDKNVYYDSYIEDIQLLDSTGKIVCNHLKFYFQTTSSDDKHSDDHINCVGEDEAEEFGKNYITDCYSDKLQSSSADNQLAFRIYIPKMITNDKGKKEELKVNKTYKVKIIHTYNWKTTHSETKTISKYTGKYRLYKSIHGYDRQALMSYEVNYESHKYKEDETEEEYKENNVQIKIKVQKGEEKKGQGEYVKYLYGVYKKGESGLGGETAVNKEYGLIGHCTKPQWDTTTGECINLEELERPKYINGNLKGEKVVLDENAADGDYVLIYKMQFFSPDGNINMATIVSNYNSSANPIFGTRLVDKFTNKSLKLMEINRTDKEELDWKNYISTNIQFNVEGEIKDDIPEGSTTYVTDPNNAGQWTYNEGENNDNGVASVSGTVATIEITRTCNNTINAVEGVSPVIEASDEVTYETDAAGNIVYDDYGEPKIKEIKDEEGNTIENNGDIKDSNGNVIGKREVEGNDKADKFAFIFSYTPQNDSGIKQTLNVSSNPVYVDNNPMNISGKVFLDGYDTSNKVTQSNNGIADNNEKWTGDSVKVELFRADYDSTNPNHYDYAKATSVSDTIIINKEDGTYTFEELDRNMYNPDEYMPSNYNGYDDIQEKMSQKISYIVKFLYNGERYETTIYEAPNQDETRTSHAKESDTGAYSTLSNITRQDFNQKIENANLRKTSPAANDEANANSANESMADYSSMYEIDATTPNGITEATSWKDHVNLGVVRRNLDLSLKNQLEYMDISINGVTQHIDSINGGVISAGVLNQDIEFLKSDYEYTDLDTSKELTATVHYKVTVKNESSDNYKATVNGINLYYDNAFTDIKVEGYTTTPIEGYGDFGGVNISCGKAITNNAGNNTTEFNIDMTLTREKIAEILRNNSGKTLETVAEISGYESYYSGDIYSTGRHKEGEVAGKLDEDSVPSNIDINKYVSEIRGSDDYAKILEFFNEDDAGTALGIKLTSNENSRNVEGRVFEDKTEEKSTDIDGKNFERNAKSRYGDGIWKEAEDKKIPNVKVELIDETNGKNKYEAETGEDGTYIFKNVIPSAKYIIQFTYGNGKTKKYNSQDYKSTIITTKDAMDNEKAYEKLNGQNVPKVGKDYYWYANEELRGKSVAKDKEKKTTSLSLNNQKAIELENYYNSDDESLDNTAETNSFFVPITKYGVSETKNNSAYTVSNMNLGIAERPRSELTITKEVDHLTITTSDGRVLIDGKQNANSISWTKKYVQAIVDENLVYGSTLKITYKYTVENTGEVNYTDNDFYYYGKKGTSEVTTSADKIIDYVDNNLMYDENMQASPDVADKVNSNYWTEASDDDLKLLGSNVIEDAKNINTKLVSTQLNKKLKPGDTTEEIYLTLSKVLSSSGDKNNESLVYNNYVEIIQSTNTAGRRSYRIKDGTKLSDLDNTKRGAPVVDDSGELKNEKNTYILTIPGDLNPKTLKTLEYEPDSAKAQEVQIVPPFGNQKIIWIAIGTTAAIILAGGVYLIKKKVL